MGSIAASKTILTAITHSCRKASLFTSKNASTRGVQRDAIPKLAGQCMIVSLRSLSMQMGVSCR